MEQPRIASASTRCPHCHLEHEGALRFCPQTGRLLQGAGADPVPGLVVDGKYRLLRAIADDATALTFEAEHQLMERRAIIWLLRSGASEPLERAFLTGMRAASALAHPALPVLHDIGRDRIFGVYAVADAIAGQTLGALLDVSGALSPARTVSVLCPILDALDAGHRAGLFHGALRAELIVVAEAVVQLWGLGLPHPTIADAEAGRRADILAVGRLLYRCLTGAVPKAETQVVPSQLRHQVPAALDAVVMRALSREGWPTAGALRDALAAAMAVPMAASTVAPPVVVLSAPPATEAPASKGPFDPAATRLDSSLAPPMAKPAPEPDPWTGPIAQAHRMTAGPLHRDPDPAEAEFWSNSEAHMAGRRNESYVRADEWERPPVRKGAVLAVSGAIGMLLFGGLALLVSGRNDARSSDSGFAAPVSAPAAKPAAAAPAQPPVAVPPPAVTAQPTAPAAPQAKEETTEKQLTRGQTEVAPVAVPSEVAEPEAQEASPPAPAAQPKAPALASPARTVARRKVVQERETPKPKTSSSTKARKIITDNPY